jgi:regulator of PEP synthase PpsR (kinase-PPPase family)
LLKKKVKKITGKKIIYAVSDSIGETAQMVAVASAGQFEPNEFEIIRVPDIKTREQIGELIREASLHNSVLCHTLVSPELNRILSEEAQKYSIPAIDVMGGMIKALQIISAQEPKFKPGTIHQLDEKYFEKIEAVEFAVKYDDGKNPQGLLKADVVLVGVSRTSKTPLSMYLAHKNIKAANVPMVPEAAVPKELFDVPPEKIVGLIIDPNKLIDIREERLKNMGLAANTNYASIERIKEEVIYAKGIMQKLKCPIIDVSNKAIEETASKIMAIIAKNKQAL